MTHRDLLRQAREREPMSRADKVILFLIVCTFFFGAMLAGALGHLVAINN